MEKTYENYVEGIRIVPGMWRPHFPWEQIAWVSPPWPSQDYLWLDFPEAIFTDQGLLFLSHVNPKFPQMFGESLRKVPWHSVEGGIAFERDLPNGVVFGGSVVKTSDTTVGIGLFLKNGTSSPIAKIQLQTCVFLRAIKEFADYTMSNKYVHVPGKGWLKWDDAMAVEGEPGKYRLGFRGGPYKADEPKMIALSNEAPRCVSMTWFDDTNTLVGNPRHPCMHADPKFRDLDSGEEATIKGELRFSEELPEGLGG